MTVYRNEGHYDTSNVVFADGEIKVYDKKNRAAGNAAHRLRLESVQGCGVRCVFRPTNRLISPTSWASSSAKNNSPAYEVRERFYEIGSPAGLAELEKLFANTR